MPYASCTASDLGPALVEEVAATGAVDTIDFKG
jgi:hypothetical protein